MTTYHRWLILPMHEYTDEMGDPLTAPRYVYDEVGDRLDTYGYSAGPFSRQDLTDAGYDHLLAHNDADAWRVVVAWGEGNDAWNALNEIHANYHDTETLADHGQDVEPVLNARFGEGNWSIPTPPPEGSENTG